MDERQRSLKDLAQDARSNNEQSHEDMIKD
jgi:hypothetical protein